jgi:17 kDa outer membrane surface antigen
VRKQLGGGMKSLAINSVRCTIGAMLTMWLSRPLRSFVSLATLTGAVVVGGCSYQLNSLAPKSGADTEQTGFTDRPQPPEVDLAYARAVAANAFTHGGKDNNIPWQNPNTGAGGNITPLARSIGKFSLSRKTTTRMRRATSACSSWHANYRKR